ncbi:hypothetical protein [Listeria floridensis]|uniref:hypothetical protein n=1 Tax=Listeria floridensis TaxID=1494962 RepID=UPI0004B6D9E8|nr:hypothetical protein [Listeria floridensis]
MTGGKIDQHMVAALLEIVNGHFWRGCIGLIKAGRNNRTITKKIYSEVKSNE